MKTTARITLLLTLLAATAARAAGDDEERARAHFEAGRVQYNLGDYKAAVHEFAAGYRLLPRPEFLVNLGQAYRRLGELERAREMYERFMADAPPDDHARPQVKLLIDEVNREIARRASAAPPQPQQNTTLTPIPELENPTPPKPPNATNVSFVRRNWWIFPVGGVVLAGIAVGIYFATRPTPLNCSTAEFGCLPVTN